MVVDVKAINEAKALVGHAREKRKWLSAHIDPYDNMCHHRVSLYVLEGTPPRGVVLVNHATGKVHAFGMGG